MNRSIVRSLVLAVAFELKLLIRQLIPAFLIGTVMWVVVCSGAVGVSVLVPDAERERIVVVVEDPEWQQRLDEDLEESLVSTFESALEHVSVEVRTTAPPDDEADVEVWIPEDAARGAWRVVGSERGSVEPVVPVAELAQAWLRQQVALDDAERGRLFALDDAADAVVEALDDDDLDQIGTPRFWASFVFVTALMFGVGSVRQNTYKRDEGLATLLRIGTPRLALYLVEMLGSALAMTLGGAFMVLIAFAGSDDRWAALPWMLVGLVGLLAMWMSTSFFGVILGTLERERDQELHLDILLMPLGAVAAYLAWDLEGSALIGLGLVPLFGLLAVGAGEQPGLQTAAVLGVQLLWGVLAVERGAWVFTLSEPLRDAVSRRLGLRRRRS